MIFLIKCLNTLIQSFVIVNIVDATETIPLSFDMSKRCEVEAFSDTFSVCASVSVLRFILLKDECTLNALVKEWHARGGREDRCV